MKEYSKFSAILKPLSPILLEEASIIFNSHHYCKNFSLWPHLVSMIYCQFSHAKSLRTLEVAMNHKSRFKPILNDTPIRRSTLSDANKNRPADAFIWIVKQLMQIIPRKKKKELKHVVRKLDSSPIQLKGRGFDEWAAQTKTKRCQGLKLHIEYDSEQAMPTGIEFSRSNKDDCTVGQTWPIKADTVYVFDKGYYDYNWWWSINKQHAFFVTRLKSNAGIVTTRKLDSPHENILEDELFTFKHKNSRRGKKNLYTKELRRVSVKREDKKTPLIWVTNLLDTPAELIAELYKERWDIELFFKWIKQNLRIKHFLGQSDPLCQGSLYLDISK